MPQPWFRFYRSVLDSKKVQALSPVLFKGWINVLCCADDDGILPTVADCAWKMRAEEAKVSQLIDDLISRGLFDRDADGAVRAHDWAEHQFKSDSSTDRVKRHRENKKQQDGTVTGNVTESEQTAGKERQRNVSPALQGTPPDTDTDSETERKKDARPRVAPPDPRFLAFWNAYPKPDGDSQTAAEIAWGALAKADQLPDGDELVRAAERFAKDRAKASNPPFAPHAKTWLIDKRWRDWAEANIAASAPDWADGDPTWGPIKALANPGMWTAWMAKCEFDRETCTLFAPTSLHVERIERLLLGQDLVRAYRKAFGDRLTVKAKKPVDARQEAA
jgi:hypothetical protein